MNTTTPKHNQKKERVINTGFRFEEIVSPEEKAIMTGIANGMTFDRKLVNNQLVTARKLNK